MSNGAMLAFRKDPPGSWSAQSKLRNPKRSNFLIVESIVAGVEMKRIITIVMA